MAGRTRTTKKLAQRINLDYFKTVHGIPRWRRILSLAFTAAGLAWLGWYGLRGSPKPYNAGPIARAHALIGQKCSACHIPAGSFQQAVNNKACLACHDGPVHHAEQTFTPQCADCHVEHKGLMRLANTTDRACTQCHADLKVKDKNAPLRFGANISAFDRTHPEFAAVRQGHPADPGTIKLNHEVHLKKDLRGPHGPVQLKCGDCHRPPGLNESFPFGRAEVVPASFPGGLAPVFRVPSRAFMEPVNYMKHCSECHTLQFDRRFIESVPHKEPQVVYDFVVKKLTEYIAVHPREIPLVDEPDKRLPSRPPQPPARNAAEWVQQRLADAQLLLWRKSCKECHTLTYPGGPDALPETAKSQITTHWLPHSEFDHGAHQMLACASCHTKAATSKETADVLIPGVQVCRDCHHNGGDAAEARCFECHVYHDWSKEKQVNGALTIQHLLE